MIKAIKKTRTVEEEGYESTCKKCGKVIFGSTENQVVFNMGLHQAGKSCFEQRVQNELPPRTPDYSSKSNKARAEE